MKKLLLLLFLTVLGNVPSYSAPPLARSLVALPTKVTETVYVCMSKGSVAYHNRDNCAGINRCTHEVKCMSIAEAQGLGKRACMKCY